MKAVAAAILAWSAVATASEWVLLPQPKFSGHAAAWPVPGSADMVLALMTCSANGEPEPVSAEELVQHPEITRGKVVEETRSLAARLLEETPAREVRDSRGVLEYVAFESQSPWTACLVLAPGFFQRFEKTIGPDAVAVIPNQFLVMVFPRSAPPPGLADLVFSAYHATNSPVSREIFQPNRAGGLISIGTTRPGQAQD